MPAPKMPPTMPSVTGTAASEALDDLLANRPGWSSDDRGWHHEKTNLRIEARAGTSPFRLTIKGSERLFATRTALELTLIQAGA